MSSEAKCPFAGGVRTQAKARSGQKEAGSLWPPTKSTRLMDGGALGLAGAEAVMRPGTRGWSRRP